MSRCLSRPLLYVCAPYRTAKVAEHLLVDAFRARAFRLGWGPVWGPALTLGFGLSDEVPAERESALEFGCALVGMCEAFAVVGTRITEGMERELLAWLPNPVILGARIKTPDELARPRLGPDPVFFQVPVAGQVYDGLANLRALMAAGS